MSEFTPPPAGSMVPVTGERRARRQKIIAAVLAASVLGLAGYSYYIEVILPGRVATANAAGLAEARSRALARARAASQAKPAPAAPVLAGAGRVVASDHAADLFAPHS